MTLFNKITANNGRAGDLFKRQVIDALTDIDPTTLATPTDGTFLVGDGTTYVGESGATARASMGVTIGTDVQAWDTDLDTYAANPLTAAELGELQNIGTTTISAAQWGYVGAMDQGVATTDRPTFAGLDVDGTLLIEQTAAQIDLYDTGGTSTHNRPSIVSNSSRLLFQTRTSAGVLVQQNYVITMDASGATNHEWYIGSSNVMDLSSSGLHVGGAASATEALQVTGNIAVSGTVDGRDVATDGTKLDTIETSADVTDATNVNAAGAVMESDYNANTILAATSDNTPVPLTVGEQTLVGRITAGSIDALTAAEVRTLINVEDGADVTDTANVTAAGALMDSEVDADLKTFALPANTTISAFGATLVDDLTAAAARATLDVDQAGTDNSTDVTLAGTPDYITISGQVITRNAIDLTTDVTGDLAVADGGTGASTASDARINLGLVIGTNVQAYDAGLASIAGLTTAADRMIYTTGSDVYAVATLTAAGRALLDDASASAQRTTLGLGTIATQAATAVNIDGGNIDGTTIGASSAAAGTFSTATVTGDLTVDATTLYVDSTNNRVGIGTTSPSKLLHLAASVDGTLLVESSAARLELYDTGGTSTHNRPSIVSNNNRLFFQTRTSAGVLVQQNYVITMDASGATNHEWYIGSSNVMDLSSSGLHVGGAASATEALQVTGNADISGNVDAASATITGDLTVDTNTLYVDSTNNRVGIGTTSPSAPLEIAGTDTELFQLQKNSTGGDTRVAFRNNTDSLQATIDADWAAQSFGSFKIRAPYNASNSSRTALEAGDDFTAIDVGGTEVLRQDATGLGLGTSSPTEKLDVNGDAIRIRTSQTPASASATGTQGMIAWDTNYIYVCTSTNTWKRATLSTW